MFGRSVFKSYAGAINLFSRIYDPLVIVLSAYFSYWYRFGEIHTTSADYKFLIIFAFLSTLVLFPSFGLYASWRGQSLLKQGRAIVMAWSAVVMTMILLLFGLKISAEFSRLWLGYWAVIGLALLLFSRLCIYGVLQYQRRSGHNYRSVVIVGAGHLARRIIDQIEKSPWTGYKIMALFDDNDKLIGQSVLGHPVSGSLDEVESYISNQKIDEVWMALPLRAEKRMKDILYNIRHHTVNVKFIPDIFGFSLLHHSLTEIAGIPAVNLSDSPMAGGNVFIKSVEDRLLGILILVLTLPLIVLIALAIKFTSPGPVIYKQKRHGWDGRVINVYKFRTMEVHQEAEGVVTQAGRNDPRLTRLGALLRRTSLDELPQLYNVLQGRMSIVGPRPHAVEHNELYKDQVDKYMLRHMVKPGITGWAQVNGYRGETDTLEKMKKRIEYDLYYIENWSIWFDLKIIFLSLFKGFINKNAY